MLTCYLSLVYLIIDLFRLLNEKYIQLIEVLSRISNSSIEPVLLEKHLTILSEDIHWILLISGFMLFEVSSEADRQLIPAEIMNYSIICSKYTDSNLISKLFSTLNISTISGQMDSISQQISSSISTQLIETRLSEADLFDPIIRLIFSSFQLCELETKMFSINMLSRLSPQVYITIYLYLDRLM